MHSFSLSTINICVKVTLLLYSFYIGCMHLQHYIHTSYTAKLNLLKFILIYCFSYSYLFISFIHMIGFIKLIYMYIYTFVWHFAGSGQLHKKQIKTCNSCGQRSTARSTHCSYCGGVFRSGDYYLEGDQPNFDQLKY